MRDLTGQKFEHLTALAPTDERMGTAVVWECICICGKTRKVPRNYLVSGRAKSCGCLDKTAMKDLTGQKFGRLTAISPTKERIRGCAVWECVCECGGRKNVSSDYLEQGRVKTCGCYMSERMGTVDISGQKFGRLTAISLTKEITADKGAIWECVCECGKKKKIPLSHLAGGGTKSCGCLKLEYNIETMKTLGDKFRVEETSLIAITQKPRTASGVKGVYLVQKTNKWRASIGFQRKKINLGTFANFEDAVVARKKAEEKYFAPILEEYRDRLTPSQIARIDDDQ